MLSTMEFVSLLLFRWTFPLWQHLSWDVPGFHSLDASYQSTSAVAVMNTTLVWHRNWMFLSWSVKWKTRHPLVFYTTKHRLCFCKLEKTEGDTICKKLLFKDILLVSQSARANFTMVILSLTPDLSLIL